MKNSSFSLLFSVLLMFLVQLDVEAQLFGSQNELTSTVTDIKGQMGMRWNFGVNEVSYKFPY